ncbi:MAG: gliding motility lipoprotein GldB [Bacteroidota bacterium]|jgi:gliding motility-associated lipoprotein GldB
MRPILISSFFFLLCAGCSSNSGEATCALDEEILSEKVKVNVVRLEKEFFTSSSKEEMLNLLDTYPDFATKVLDLEAYPNKDSLARALVLAQEDSSMQALNRAVGDEFADFSDITKDLENAFTYLKWHYPGFKVPKVYTYVSGFGMDLLIEEETIVIGLDYFLPSDHKFQPDLPVYMKARYQREYLVPMIVLAISSRYNEVDPKDNTLLAEMIYFGKAYHFVKSIMPCTSDQFIIGYMPDQLASCWENEDVIWTHFIENELLFETNPFEIRKYIGEAPFTDAISSEAPGRLGRWVGWNIVEQYQEKEGISLVELMAEANAEKIFRDSKYRPQKPE